MTVMETGGLLEMVMAQFANIGMLIVSYTRPDAIVIVQMTRLTARA